MPRGQDRHEVFKLKILGAQVYMRGKKVCQGPARTLGVGLLVGGVVALAGAWAIPRAIRHFAGDSRKYPVEINNFVTCHVFSSRNK